MAAPFGNKMPVAAEDGDLILIQRGEGSSAEVEKIDPTAAETGLLIADGLDAALDTTAWRPGGVLGPFAVDDLPDASEYGGRLAYVTNGAAGDPCLAISDGMAWKIIAAFGATVSAT